MKQPSQELPVSKTNELIKKSSVLVTDQEKTKASSSGVIFSKLEVTTSNDLKERNVSETETNLKPTKKSKNKKGRFIQK